jgi:hypothetical protein
MNTGFIINKNKRKEVNIMAKKEWEKPELIVLVKGRLEENVLRVCKTSQGNCPYFACSALDGRCDGIGSS